MLNMMRHVGKIANTDQRCIVAFMQIPGRLDHALVIPTDGLPPRFEQAVTEVLRSSEGQNEETFGTALSRRLMPDSGKDILTALHENAYLTAIPCANVLMLPMPNQPIKLTDILTQLGRYDAAVMAAPPDEYLEKFNPHTHNQRAASAEQARAIASNLLIEAQMLEVDARKKRERAYEYDPSLRPAPVAIPERPDAQPADPLAAAMEIGGRIDDSNQMNLDALLEPPTNVKKPSKKT